MRNAHTPKQGMKHDIVICYFISLFSSLDFNGIVIGMGPIVGSFEETKNDGTHPGIIG